MYKKIHPLFQIIYFQPIVTIINFINLNLICYQV